MIIKQHMLNKYAEYGKKLTYSQQNYVYNTIDEGLKRTAEHYRNSRYKMDSQHPLFRLLDHFNFYISHPLDEYLAIIEEESLAIASACNFVTMSGSGLVFDGYFLGKGCQEVIYVRTTPPFLLCGNWESLEPVKITAHGGTYTSANIPNGDVGLCDSFATILIDITCMSLQYWKWVRYNQSKPEESRETMADFILKYPLVNATKSAHRVAMFNRIHNELLGADNPTDFIKTSYWNNDITPRIDDLHERMISETLLSTNDRTFMSSLSLGNKYSLIDLIKADDGRDSLLVNEWAHLMADLPFIKFYVDYHNLTGNGSRDILNVIKLELKRIKRRNSMGKCGDDNVKSYLMGNLSDLVSRL